MTMTPEMAEMMERTMEQYFAAYWQKHATAEQEAKRKAEGKTFKGAYTFARSVAEKMRGKSGDNSCVAMPDDLAYWILMEYMENEVEGATFKTPEDVEREAKAKQAEAERKAKDAIAKAKAEQERLEKKAAELNAGSMFEITAEQVKKAETEAAKAKKEAERLKSETAKKKETAKKIAKKIEELQMTLF